RAPSAPGHEERSRRTVWCSHREGPMLQLHTCSCGHQWESSGEPGAGTDVALRCPVCGAAGTSSVTGTSLRGETLPPPPRLPQAPTTSGATLESGEPRLAPEATRPAVAGYEVLGELGRGGMGVVLKARQLSLKRVVALKMLKEGSFPGSHARARFH